MTIHPRPDQERLIEEAMRAGVIHSAEEALDVGLEGLRDRLGVRERPAQATKQSLVEFFRNSPLVGLELNLERDRDTGRDIDL